MKKEILHKKEHKMQSLYYELRIIIFKYVDTPISLILTDRKWYAITQDPYARAEWLIYKYGKTHAIFHAVRLGSDFITVGLVRNLLVRNAIISRYFIQRLLMSIGSEGKKLIEIRNKHNANQVDFDNSTWSLQKKIRFLD